MRAHEPWRDPPLRTDRRLSLQRPLREERTLSGEPGCLPSSGSNAETKIALRFHVRPASFSRDAAFRLALRLCVTRERLRLCYLSLKSSGCYTGFFPLAGFAYALDGFVGGERLDRGVKGTGVPFPSFPIAAC